MSSENTDELLMKNNILNEIKYSKNSYYYHNGDIYIRIKKNLLCKTIFSKMQKNDKNIPESYVETISKYIKKNINQIKILDITKNTLKNKKYIGYKNSTYDIVSNVQVKDPSVIITNVLDYEYKANINPIEISNKREINIYDYLMMSIYEKFRYDAHKYYLKFNDSEETINTLKTIFSNYINFINIDDTTKKTDRIIMYGNDINSLKIVNHIIIPMDDVKIDATQGENIFNEIFDKYRCIYESKEYDIPNTIEIVKNKLIEENMVKKKAGRKKLYQTDEERIKARKEYLQKWRHNEESKLKVKLSQDKYRKKNEEKLAIKKLSIQGYDSTEVMCNNKTEKMISL
jgi:hypothetical protein